MLNLSHEPELLCPLTREPLHRPSASRPLQPLAAEVVEYPRLGRLQLVLPGASVLLASTVIQAQQRRRGLDTLASGANAREFEERFAAALAAERCNVELIEGLCSPIVDYLGDERQLAKGLSAAIARHQAGWSLDAMLPYFYQDWCADRPADPTAACVRAWLREHAGVRRSAALLGCGAGGMLRVLAPEFESVTGVDLSVLSMLLVQQLLDGAAVRIAVPAQSASLPESPLATLQGLGGALARVQLIAADATDLPFRDASLDCVVTQYLLDILPNPRALFEEINRVLADGGIWINHGCPFRMAEDPAFLRARKAEDIPPLLQTFGMHALEVRTLRHDHLNLTALSQYALRTEHGTIAFVARKHTALPRSAALCAFDAYFRARSRELFELVPRLRPSEPVTYLCGTETALGTTRPTALLGIGRQRFTPLGDVTSCPPVMTSLVHGCLQRFDGRLPLSEVFDRLHTESAGLLEEEDFVVSLRLMRNLGWADMLTSSA